MDMLTISALIGEIVALVAAIVPVIVAIKKVSNGTKCQLRSEMLRIYYHHHESKVIRQYEKENFVMLYEAYKTLKGNSFIEDIYKEVRTWKVVS